MIFTFKYVQHPVESLHEWIQHLVLEVWCKADGIFDINKLTPAFKPVVEKVSNYLLNPIESIYNIFLTLTDAEKDKLAKGFIHNNSLEEVCAGVVDPMTYNDIKAISPILALQMEAFFTSLYNNVLGLGAYTSRCGKLKDYYNAFMQENTYETCPFCGLSDLKSDLLSKREAYDHYLPKGTYPFNSVNFKNLVPTCNTCNSSYKGSKEMIVDKLKKRRKAFYPYSQKNPDVSFEVIVETFDEDNPKKSDVKVTVNSATQSEELGGWLEVYGLQERFEAKCKIDSKYWISQFAEELDIPPKEFEGLFLREMERRKRYAHKEQNFLRVPFLLSYKNKYGFKNRVGLNNL